MTFWQERFTMKMKNREEHGKKFKSILNQKLKSDRKKDELPLFSRGYLRPSSYQSKIVASFFIINFS